MFQVKWKKLGIHYHCRVFVRSAGGGWAKIGDLTMDEKDWENFQFSILAKHWRLVEDKEVREDEEG